MTWLRASLLALAAACLVVTMTAPAATQAELQLWVDPTLGKMMGRADYRITLYSDERVVGQSTRLDLTQHNEAGYTL